MSAALIVIEVAAPDVSDDALSVLVSSCTRAAREAQCVLTKNASDEPPAAVAIVSQQGEDKLRVEVGVRQGDRDSWHSKDFAFLAADQLMDRWRAIGFAIGTLAESTVSPAPPPSAVSETPPAPPSVPISSAPPEPIAAKPKQEPSPSLQLFLGAAGFFGPGLDQGPWRLGSALYADIGWPRVPVFFTFGGSAATRFTSDRTGTAARWIDLNTGAGVALLGALADSGLELRAQALLEEFDVSVSSVDGRSDEKGRWIFGVQGELGGRLQLVPDLFLAAGLSAATLSGATEVLVAGHGIGSAPTFRYLGNFGIRLRLR